MKNEIFNRINILRYIISLKKIDFLVISDKHDICYLTGLYKKKYNNLKECLLISYNKILLISNNFDKENCKKRKIFYNHDVVYTTGKIANKLYLILTSINANVVAFENGCLFYDLYIAYNFNKNFGIIKIVQTNNLIKNIRVIKSLYETRQTIKSLRISEKAFLIFVNSIRRFSTEEKTCIKLKNVTYNLGVRRLAFSPIIVSDSDKSFPHAKSRESTIKFGETLMIDCGAKICGYSSDFTRIISFEDIDKKFLNAYKIILNTQVNTILRARYGVRNKKIDLFARKYIKKKGYYKRFIHGLGHGTGLSVHELPKIYKYGNLFFENGMILTIEPGLYISNWTGIRLENQVIIKKKYFKILNKLSLNLYMI